MTTSIVANKFFSFFLFVVIIFSCSSQADEYSDGINEIKKGNDEIGMSYLKIASSKGNYKATYMLGLIYEKTGDHKTASEYFKQTTELGNLFKENKLRTFNNVAGNMKNTIEIGDDILAIRTNDVKRGDLIIFIYPQDEKTFYTKRCIATSGDTVMIRDKNLYVKFSEGNEFMFANYPKQTIEINKQIWVKNPYRLTHKGIHNDPTIINDGTQPQELFDFLPVVIPQDECFMMGDNRDHSNDSRFWGTVNLKGEIYKPLFVIYSNNQQRVGLELK